METTETTNTEGTETTEEEVVETEEEETTENDDESKEESEEESEEATDDEKETLKKEVEELKTKNKGLYDKLKDGYKKHSKNKDKSFSKEDVRLMMEEIKTEDSQEKTFLEKNEDAKDFLPEIKKLQEEKGFDIDTAYDVVRWKMLRDEAYRNQILGDRSKNYWTFEKKEAGFKYKELFTVPKVSKPRTED